MDAAEVPANPASPRGAPTVTIVVGVASPDGIILAADSRTTYTDGQRHRIGTDSADKVFEPLLTFPWVMPPRQAGAGTARTA
jgi:hypothetical protein